MNTQSFFESCHLLSYQEANLLAHLVAHLRCHLKNADSMIQFLFSLHVKVSLEIWTTNVYGLIQEPNNKAYM